MCSCAGRENLAKSVITKLGSAREASKDFCGGQGIRTRREEWRTPELPPQPTIPHTHKADFLRYFDLTDNTATDIVREVRGVTDAKGVRT